MRWTGTWGEPGVGGDSEESAPQLPFVHLVVVWREWRGRGRFKGPVTEGTEVLGTARRVRQSGLRLSACLTGEGRWSR